MSSVSGVSNSLLNSLLSSSTNKSASSQADTLKSSINADVVSLLNNSTDPESSVYNILGGTQNLSSEGSMYNLLLSAENAQLMKDNPTLLKALIGAAQTQYQTASDGTSTDSTKSEATGTDILNYIQNINLLTMNPDNLLSILQKTSENSTAQTASVSQIDQTV